MKQRLELMAAVGAHRVNAEGKRPGHLVCEGDGVLLCVSPVDAERADPGGIIDRRVLVATDSLPGWPLKREEFHVDLHVMPGDLFGIAMGMHGAPAHAIGQTAQPVAPQYAVDGGVRDAHALVARQVPDDPLRAEVIGPPQVQHLLHDLRARGARM